MKESLFIPKIKGRMQRAKELGIVIKLQYPYGTNLIFLQPAIEWSHVHPNYMICC